MAVSSKTPTLTRILTVAWKSAYAMLGATILAVGFGIGFFTYGGIFGPLSDAGGLLVGMFLAPLVWAIHLLNENRRFNRVISSVGIAAVAGISIGSIGLILRYLLSLDLGIVGSSFLGIQFLGWLPLGVWLLGVGTLGLRNEAISKRVSWAAFVSGVGASGGIVTLLYSYAAESFTLAFPVFMALYAGGFVLWAFWLAGDLRTAATSVDNVDTSTTNDSQDEPRTSDDGGFRMAIAAGTDSEGLSIDPRSVVLAVGTSIGGLLVHNLAEFSPSILFAPETLVPIGITVFVGVAMLNRPGRGIFLTAAAWAIIVLLFGGGSVLPLDILPFVPEQTLDHYAAHVVYALAQLPLLWVAWCGFRAARQND